MQSESDHRSLPAPMLDARCGSGPVPRGLARQRGFACSRSVFGAPRLLELVTASGNCRPLVGCVRTALMNVLSPPDPTTIDAGQKSLLGMQVNISAQKFDLGPVTHPFRLQSQESGESSAPLSPLSNLIAVCGAVCRDASPVSGAV